MTDKKIGSWIFSPFIYIAGWPALLIGLTAILAAGGIGSFSNTHFDGVLDTHSGADAPLWFYFAAGLIDWLCMGGILLLLGKAVVKTPFRIIDLFGTQAMARYPSLFVALATLPAGYLRFTHYVSGGAATPINTADAILFGAAVLVMLLALGWMITLMYQGYSISCNVKGGKAAGTFIGGIIMAEILSKIIIVALLSSLANTSAQAVSQTDRATVTAEQSTAAAVKAAKETLKLIDEQHYAESWDESADFFKNAVNKQQWIAAMKQTRKPMGRLISRVLINAKPMTQLPNAPTGKYVVIQFKTTFENKKEAIETFTPMLDQEGTWRMTGYFIK